MFQVRIYGRGGQGVVTAAELLSVAAFLDGLHAQAIPNFGPERMGAPVMANCRLDSRPIRSHEPITETDAVIVLDPTLLYVLDVFNGLSREGFALINSSRSFADLGLEDVAAEMPDWHLVTVAATAISRGVTGRPLPNTPLLGAFSALTGQVTLPSVHAAITRRFRGISGILNVQAASIGASGARTGIVAATGA